jgi:ribA/ribD-fused uncharacterized protein
MEVDIFIKVIPFYEQYGEYGCFSQFYKCSTPILIYNKAFQYSEGAMMYAKASLFPNNEDIKKKILASEYPHEIKGFGRQVRNFNQEIWDAHKYQIVLECNKAKFYHNPKLLLRLMETKNTILVEASPYDKIWGAGIDKNHPDINNPECWPGQNLLGKVLMEIRNQN